jgi:hypothetical protein
MTRPRLAWIFFLWIAALINAQSNSIQSTVNTTSIRFKMNATYFNFGGLFELTNANGINTKGVDRAEAFMCAIQRVNNMSSLLPNSSIFYMALNNMENVNTALFYALKLLDIEKEIVGIIGYLFYSNFDRACSLFIS